MVPRPDCRPALPARFSTPPDSRRPLVLRRWVREQPEHVAVTALPAAQQVVAEPQTQRSSYYGRTGSSDIQSRMDLTGLGSSRLNQLDQNGSARFLESELFDEKLLRDFLDGFGIRAFCTPETNFLVPLASGVIGQMDFWLS